MPRRHHSSDPLQPTNDPRWYVVRSRHGKLVESYAIPTGTHLKRLFIAKMLEYIDAGWEIREFSSLTGLFHCERHPEQYEVNISPSDPHEPVPMMYGPSRPW